MKDPLTASTLALLVIFPGGIAAQDPPQTVVPAEHTCPQCEIEAVRTVTVGGTDLPFSLRAAGLSVVLQDEHLVTVVFPGDQLAVFDSSGTFLRTLGRAGEGPGEFREVIGLFVDASDSLFAYDAGAAKVEVFGPELVRARSFRLVTPSIRGLRRLTGGGFVLAGRLPGPERVGLPLHVLSAEGEVLQSFVRGEAVLDPYRPSISQRRVAHQNGRVYAVRPDRYEIEVWRMTPEPVCERILVGGVDWFPPRDYEFRGSPYEFPPDQWVRAVRVDDEGLLWVLGTTAIDGWQPHPDPGTAPELTANRYNRFHQTVIEVIDPDTGHLVARGQVAGESLRGFAADGLAYGFREDELGESLIDLWRLRLHRP